MRRRFSAKKRGLHGATQPDRPQARQETTEGSRPVEGRAWSPRPSGKDGEHARRETRAASGLGKGTHNQCPELGHAIQIGQ